MPSLPMNRRHKEKMTLASQVQFKSPTGAWTSLLNLIYPVGTVYSAYNSTAPGSRFGGEWSAITGRYPYYNASNATDNASSTSHTHSMTGGYVLGGMWDTGDGYGIAWRTTATQWGYTTTKDYQAMIFPRSSVASVHISPTNISNAVPRRIRLDGTTVSGGGASPHPAYQALWAWRRTA